VGESAEGVECEGAMAEQDVEAAELEATVVK
jgi:hypothetical protein